jgi:hypothetical protein
MKIVEKIIFIFLLISGNLSAGTIGASLWEKEGVRVCIYHDVHDLIVLDHIGYIERDVFTSPVFRSKPLTVLVENYYSGKYEDVLRALDLEVKKVSGNNFFLSALGFLKPPENVKVRNVESMRMVPVLFEAVTKGLLGTHEFSRDLIDLMVRSVKTVSLNDLLQEAEARYKVYRNFGSSAGNAVFNSYLDRGYKKFSGKKKEFCDLVHETYKHMGDDVFKKPALEILLDELGRGDRGNMAALLCSHMFVGDLFSTLTDINILFELIRAVGNYALFAGTEHCLLAESFLRDSGFSCLMRVGDDRLRVISAALDDDTIDDWDELTVQRYFSPVSKTVFDWMCAS